MGDLFFWGFLMGIATLVYCWWFPWILFILTNAINSPFLTFLGSYIWLFVVFLILAITAAIVFFFFIWLVFMSISYLGVYKKLNTEDPLNGESLIRKIVINYFLNIFLSLFLLTVIFYFLYPSSTIPILTTPALTLTESDYTYILAIGFVPAYLLSIRILANPTKNVFSIPVIDYYTHPSDKKSYIKSFKKEVISFYFALTVGAILYLFFKLMQASTNNRLDEEVSKFYPHFDLISLLILGSIYMIILFITTTIGEYYLKMYPPFERL